jgi:DNA end-binding protein Ku
MVVITDTELDAAVPEMSRDIELKRSVPTMKRGGKVGIGSFVMRGHEYLVVIISEAGILRAETLRFADEVRSPEDIGLSKIAKVPAKRVNAFVRAIEG